MKIPGSAARLLLLLLLCLSGLAVVLLGERLGLPDALARLGSWTPLTYVLVRTVLTGLGVPTSLLTIVAGASFGFVAGTVYSVAAASLGAVAAFLIARYLGREWSQKQLERSTKLANFDRTLGVDGLWPVLSCRLNVLLPFNILNTLFGLSRVRLRDFVLGTALGIIPGTALYAWLGASGEQALKGGSAWGAWVALLLAAALTLVPWLLTRRQDTTVSSSK